MALTDAEKTDVRRFCGYAVRGTAQMDGPLETRMANLSEAEAVVTRRYLASLTALEQAIPAAGDHLDTEQAAAWTRNRDELRDRIKLFDNWRRRLCGFLGVPVGPAMSDSGLTLIV